MKTTKRAFRRSAHSVEKSMVAGGVFMGIVVIGHQAKDEISMVVGMAMLMIGGLVLAASLRLGR